MTDENNKTGVNEDGTVKKEDTVKKADTTKKSATTTSKKVKTESIQNTDEQEKKNKVIEKLQAMGVMSGGKINTAERDKAEKGNWPKIRIAIVVVIFVVGSFVWILNKEAANEQVASSVKNIQTANRIMPSAYPGAGQVSSYNPHNNNAGYPIYNYEKQKLRLQQQRAQQKWEQQQQQAYEQQRAQQQKWAQQQQQAQQQYQAQYQKWVQQQQPYYTYPSYAGNKGLPVPSPYNYAPRQQQPWPYYGRQY